MACVMNVSVNPAYATTVNLRVTAYNAAGQRVEADGARVPPFGTVWIDLLDLFGDDVVRLLARSQGRGAYTIVTDDASCIGYHFLYHPETGKYAGDHTRPLMSYLSRCYGAKPLTLRRPRARDFLHHAGFVFYHTFLARGRRG